MFHLIGFVYAPALQFKNVLKIFVPLIFSDVCCYTTTTTESLVCEQGHFTSLKTTVFVKAFAF